MKRCPTCNRTFTDQNLVFCTDDGTPLVTVTAEEQPTEMYPPPPGSETPQAGPSDKGWSGPTYQPPGSYVPPGASSKQKAWPWVVAVLVVLLLAVVGLGIAAAIMIPRMLRASSNQNTTVTNSNQGAETESNLNSNVANGNANANANANAEVSPTANTNNENSNTDGGAPSDASKVLADLTDIENEWTRANINADKKALDRILADDYVGTSSDGTTQGKAEYIRTIKRDTVTERWNFSDLKVDLKGDRAALTGLVSFVVNDQELAFRFTDKFVWRDGRWQAVSSEVTQVTAPGKIGGEPADRRSAI